MLMILTVNALIVAACFVLLWIISIATRDPSFVDSWWALGLALLAAASLLQVPDPGPRNILLAVLCVVWGLRLGLYLLWRWRINGADPRYEAMLGKAQRERGWSFAKASLLLVFALQAPLQFIVGLPVILGQSGSGDIGLLSYIGAALAITGIAFESIGDWQLVRFKSDPTNHGKVLDIGLWRYTRHPNYFGDACVWWGLYLIAAQSPVGVWSLPGPVLITFLLTRFSGVPTVEGSMRKRRPDYEAYIKRTSGFIPWFPKKA
jgi:steroid 5-alpha reductase family enzyme